MAGRVHSPTQAYYDRMKPWTVAIWRLLQKEPEVELSKVIATAKGKVPPGVAFRYTVGKADWEYYRDANPADPERRIGRQMQRYDDEKAKQVAIEYGQRQKVRASLHTLEVSGRVTITRFGNEALVSRGPNWWPFDPPPEA